MEHLSRALPSDLIFFQLRSIPSKSLMPSYFSEFKLEIIEIIIKWLQVSASECRVTNRSD